MSSTRISEPIRIGLVTDEPIRVAGLASIFDQPVQQDQAQPIDQAQFVPVIGSLPELLALATIEYIVVDLHSSPHSIEALESVRDVHRGRRLIVIGPEDDDELILRAIVAGARGYLGPNAGPELVRKAIEAVTSGSIWAPRRLLARLIDRLLKVSHTVSAAPVPQLTLRERQVLELLLKAHSTREIASQLDIEQRTVKAYIARLMRKTGADNRIKLSVSALNGSLRPKGTGRHGHSSEPHGRSN
jgi:DNA-binding NarL/FixJ family response regulator